MRATPTEPVLNYGYSWHEVTLFWKILKIHNVMTFAKDKHGKEYPNREMLEALTDCQLTTPLFNELFSKNISNGLQV